jgi:adenylosuccinate synthase
MIRNVDILVGGQFGSEAKGLVADQISQINNYDWVISVNSAQAGHTTYFNGNKIVTRQLPSSCISNHKSNIYIGPGAIINVHVLLEEIKMLEEFGIPISNRLYINSMATIITDLCIEKEKEFKLNISIGSTCEGVGYALSERCKRKVPIIKDVIPEIKKQYEDITFIEYSDLIYGDIFIEGSQGYGLSVFSEYYPFCTSRDTTASAFLSYSGLPPRNVRDIYGVFRTYPIRVGGNSGPMRNELCWGEINNRSGYSDLLEYTTVTGRVRRIGEFDYEMTRKAIKYCGINKPVLTFVNYLNIVDEGITSWDFLSDKTKRIIEAMECTIGAKFYAISTSKDAKLIIR